jgi:hypothetical protein
MRHVGNPTEEQDDIAHHMHLEEYRGEIYIYGTDVKVSSARAVSTSPPSLHIYLIFTSKHTLNISLSPPSQALANPELTIVKQMKNHPPKKRVSRRKNFLTYQMIRILQFG